MRSRQPKQLLLAFFGEHVLDQGELPLRASVLIEVLEGAGVAAPATRATLDRMVRRGLISRERRGREILFTLTSEGSAVLREATERVRGPHPFEPHGSGWTLVTFTVPENQRTLRHRLRSALTWEGFAPLRDGLWLAPGEVDLKSALEPLQADLPPAAITAFHAQELPGYAMADNVRAAWDIDRIRDEHLSFIETWSDPATSAEAGTALSAQTMLVADWLELLRADPRLPRAFMNDDWPADQSFEVYWAGRHALEEPAAAQFAELAGVSPRSATADRPSAPSPMPSAAARRR
ncbi:PaaX family transcriptional regulator [Agromyces albus]|uniref:PaaX family transcriptional regulator n=1 Tax=Agromyces albus TaxID=205332 RepID=UPI00278A244E|nr:PaaX family transcriptional regulator C-terminal domain-containing protein [Agromyces albus]MDQ0576515.1 phenylacetic acid degradation operon negative regulatory protein [Agromyces albus]